ERRHRLLVLERAQRLRTPLCRHAADAGGCGALFPGAIGAETGAGRGCEFWGWPLISSSSEKQNLDPSTRVSQAGENAWEPSLAQDDSLYLWRGGQGRPRHTRRKVLKAKS